MSDDWQTIESAPKDGTPVDLWVEDWSDEPKRFIDAFFMNGHWWYDDDGEHGPYCIDDNRHISKPCRVTHWMPPPEPPHA